MWLFVQLIDDRVELYHNRKKDIKQCMIQSQKKSKHGSKTAVCTYTNPQSKAM